MNELDFYTYISYFNMHYKLLLRRYERYEKINNICNTDIDVITYLDIIIVQLRALCIESPNLKKNYTAQNLLRLMKRDDLAQEIDTMLEKQFFSHRELSIKEALKIMADKYICHYDAIKDDEIVLAEIIEKQLRSPHDEHNLAYIMKTVVDCIAGGLSKESFFNAVEIVEE